MANQQDDLYAVLSGTPFSSSTDADDPGGDDLARTLTFTVESVDQDRNAVLLNRLRL